MKTIQVSDEMYEFLMNLSREMNSQSHRGTRMPYFFQVQTQHQIPVPEGSGTEAWHYDGSLIESDEEIKETIIEIKGWEDTPGDFDELDVYDIEDILESNGWSKGCYDYEYRYNNSFFTSKACDEHIKLNKHNLTEPVNYLSYATRNPEMEILQKFICGLTGGDLHI